MKRVLVKVFISLAISVLFFEASGHLFSEKHYYLNRKRYFPVKPEQISTGIYTTNKWKDWKNSKDSWRNYIIYAFNYKMAYTIGFTGFGIILLILMIPELKKD
jgi:hypothetical protein